MRFQNHTSFMSYYIGVWTDAELSTNKVIKGFFWKATTRGNAIALGPHASYLEFWQS